MKKQIPSNNPATPAERISSAAFWHSARVLGTWIWSGDSPRKAGRRAVSAFVGATSLVLFPGSSRWPDLGLPAHGSNEGEAGRWDSD